MTAGDSPYTVSSPPPQVSTTVRQDGKLVDHDTAEVTAIPDTLNPSSKGRLSTSFGDSISRPTSAASMRVRIDKPSLEAISGRSLYTHVPTGFEGTLSLAPCLLLHFQRFMIPPSLFLAGNASPQSISSLFAHRGGAPPYGNPTLYSTLRLTLAQLLANCLSSVFLILVVIWALSVRLLAAVPKLLSPSIEEKSEWDDPGRWKKEKLVKDVRYYARSCGFDIVNETCETADGYFLRINRIICPERQHERRSDGRGEFVRVCVRLAYADMFLSAKVATPS